MHTSDAESYDERTRRSVESRQRSGEFDDIIEHLRTLSFGDYSGFVAAPSPIVDPEGNRLYLSADHALYLYVGDTTPDNRFYLCTIDRGAEDKVT